MYNDIQISIVSYLLSSRFQNVVIILTDEIYLYMHIVVLFSICTRNLSPSLTKNIILIY